MEVPAEVLQGWQQTVDLIAEVVDIPACLIMRVHSDEIEVFISSQSPGNPYPQNETAELGFGLYCETVIYKRQELLVPNALTDPAWDKNPDIPLGMISYCGLPLYWPNGNPFGTICMLDKRENSYTPRSRQLLARFQAAIETDLITLYQQAELKLANLLLEQRIHDRTIELERINHQLALEIDTRTAMQRSLEYHQQYDSLTGLANRFSLTDRLTKMLQHPDDAKNGLAVIYLGLRNFKSINDSYGYVIGDKVLVELSHRIRQQLASDHFIARGTGDEFVVLMPSDDAPSQALELVNRLSQCITRAFNIEDHSITVLVNSGIALAPTDSREAVALLQKAGAAMSASKELGRYLSFFSTATQNAIDERYQLETHLVDALRNNELTLHYQPLICIETRKVLGAEALLRWHNPVLGQVAPDRFIGLAERNGQIIEIGNFVLRTAIEQAEQWQQLAAPFRIAVNISPVQFRDDQLVDYIQHLLTCYSMPAECLELEITEGVLLQDEHQASRMIKALQALGLRISLDDFGTGYSSLSYLQKYAFDTLKIDRSFIGHLADREQDRELARAIIAMAKKLKLHVIAEGVETTEQDQFILAEGCEIGQGYLYGRPVPADQFTRQYLSDTNDL
ncbi:MAG: bifunctional diguanylate cyclase/phosphodiesterase [Amphritea sp.]